MTKSEALGMIKTAVDQVAPGMGSKVDLDADLSRGILDSLDLMSFDLALEDLLGAKIEALSGDYNDYQVATLINVLLEVKLEAA